MAEWVCYRDGTGIQRDVPALTGQKTSWTFDRPYQLINEHRSGSGGFNTSFTFDAVGNRLVKNESGALTTSAFDAANQLVTSVAPSGTTTYAFDAAGNQQIEQAPSGTTTNVWNYENQLIGVQMADGSRVTMAYNANFRRTKRDP
jgi:YD repeat-containing protein